MQQRHRRSRTLDEVRQAHVPEQQLCHTPMVQQ
jgi:hypothetical protein